MIDFHCHVDLYPDPAHVLDRAEELGIYILAVTTTPKAWRGTKKLVSGRKRIRLALGLHPELVEARQSEISLFEALLPETRYVGEIGLDGSPHLRSGWDVQQATFARILRACQREGGKILSLHSRRASSAVLDALEAAPGSGTPILHWFSGAPGDLRRAVALGCWFSVGPEMLRSGKGRNLVEGMPADRLLTETDGPFANVRGEALMPWDVRDAESQLASIWACDTEDAGRRLKANLKKLLESDTFSEHSGAR